MNVINKFHCSIGFYIHFKKLFAHRPDALKEIYESIQGMTIIKSITFPFVEINANGNNVWNGILVKPVRK